MNETLAPHVVVLSGGVGGARFLRGVREELRRRYPDGVGGTTAKLTAIVNTGDDMWLAGLRITPDLDSIMYTLAGANDEERGWGRIGETERVAAELAEYGVGWPWFTLGDLDLGTHIARSSLLRDGLTLSEATARITARWNLGVTLLPVTDDQVETHVITEDGADLHFQEWWTRFRASRAAAQFVQRGVELARPAPGVIEAIASASVILVAPSNPVVSIGTILGIPGVSSALAAAGAGAGTGAGAGASAGAGAGAPIVGVSPIIGGAVVRGMADACLTAIGVATSAQAVAEHYGARVQVQAVRESGTGGSTGAVDTGGRAGAGLSAGGGDSTGAGRRAGGGGLLNGWLVDEVDAAAAAPLAAAGITTAVAPLWMTDLERSAALAGAALDLAARVQA